MERRHARHVIVLPGAVDLFESGATNRDGDIPVNVSGGLESKGHPIAATGIANIYEVATHLRGEAGNRQESTGEGHLGHHEAAAPPAQAEARRTVAFVFQALAWPDRMG